MQVNYYGFSTAQNCFWTCWFWCHLVLLPFFVSPLPHGQNISLWALFLSRKTNKKVTGVKIRWIGRLGHGGHGIFGWKLLNTQCGVGRCALNHPSWNGQMHWVFKKKFTEAEHNLSQQCQLVRWYRWIPRTLSLVGEAYTLPPERKKDM